MSKPLKMKDIFFKFFELYPLLFGILFLVLLIEGAVSALSILAVVPLGDFLLDPSLEAPSRITRTVLLVFKYIDISPNFWLFGLFFALLNIIKGVLDILIQFTVLRIQFTVVRGLIRDSLKKFFKARWSFFSGTDQGLLLNTFSKEMASIGSTFGHLATFIAKIIQFIIYISVPLWLNPSFTITALGISFLVGVPFVFVQKTSYRLGKLNTKTSNNAMSVLTEILQGARLVLGYGLQEKARNKYLREYDKHVSVHLKSQVLIMLVLNLYRPIGLLAIIIAMGLVLKPETNFAEIAAVLWSLLASLPILAQLLQGNLRIKNFLPAYEQLESLNRQASIVEEIEGKQVFHRLTQGIKLRNVDFSYSGQEKTLKNINLEISKGQMTALVGESGSGKSTVTDLVLGLQIPLNGEVLLDEQQLSKWKQNSFRERVGYVPQDPFLFHTSIKENLLWSYDRATEEEIWEACRLANALEFVTQLKDGIDTIVGNRGLRLSGGQRQRIALARALLRKPELLILDEATSSLDSKSESLIQQSIDYLSENMTLLVVSHRLSTIFKADMIYVLKEGRVVEQGNYAQLLKTNSIFTKMAKHQSLL
jgi:ABC-type multidrug transport system fused ATPase/permease subunit